jgi:hypothetical protein
MNIFRSLMRAVLASASLLLGTLPALAAGPSGGVNRAVPLPGLTAPSALHYTTSVETCKANGGSDSSCGALAMQGAVAFYASWHCAGCTATGFKLRIAAAKFDPRYAVRLAAPGADAVDVSTQPVFVEAPPTGGWKGQCYVVVAFHNPTRAFGSGGMGPVGQATGAYEESPPSSQACVIATTRSVLLPSSAERGYQRTYTIVYSTGIPKITDFTPNTTSGPFLVGWQFLALGSQSRENTYFRAAVEFDRSSLGDATIFGGTLTQNVEEGDTACTHLSSPAPAGWESAAWTKPTGSVVTGGTVTKYNFDTNVDAFARGWTAPKRLTFFLDPTKPAESVESGLLKASSKCRTLIKGAFLALTVSVTK